MELIELKNFSEIFGEIGKKDYGEARKMSEELKEYSFFNNAFVFEKKSNDLIMTLNYMY